MKIYFNSLGPVATNAYLICDEQTNECVLIDTPAGSFDLFKGILTENKLQLNAIWLTHSHWDHTWDLNLFKDEYGVKIIVHKDDIHRLDAPNDYINFDLGMTFEPMKYDEFVSHQQKINIGNYEFEVLHTPGHTEGSVCFVCHNQKIVIAGDTLFNQSIGRTDLAGGNYNQLIKSIKENLLILPDEYKVYCGHGEPTQIGFEKNHNQFLN